jgi:hypothetical protein
MGVIGTVGPERILDGLPADGAEFRLLVVGMGVPRFALVPSVEPTRSTAVRTPIWHPRALLPPNLILEWSTYHLLTASLQPITQFAD